jgi:hypothetical protein
MAHHFDFDPLNRLLRCKFSATVTDVEVKTCYAELGDLAKSLEPNGGVVDLSDVTSFEVSVKTVRELARREPAIPNPSRSRIIAAVSPHIFGLARIFELEGETTRPNLHVVHTEREAWAILGVKEPRFEPIPVRR